MTKTIYKPKYSNAIMAYIEQHLYEELNPESIAKQHYISLSRLYRDFYAYTGHSVKEYIRKRRISNACEKIKCSDLSLAIIADESGCQTQQAFHKQFKNIVGMTPLEYRQSDTYFYFYPFAANDISIAVRVGKESIPECTATRFYDSCLSGIEDKAIAALGEVNGRIFGRNGKQIGKRFCYEVMTEIDGVSSTNLYATCVVNYNEAEISDGWNYLYNIWLPSSMFEESGEDYFEEYIFQNGKPHRLKLYLPVKKRKAAQHIKIMQISEMQFITARESGHNAEKKAAKKVMDYMREAFPNSLRNARCFYVCETSGEYICGTEWEYVHGLGKYEHRVAALQIPAGKYAVLSDNCFGDIRVGREKIESWCVDNSIAHEGEPVFAVYESLNGKYDADSIRMNLFKRLKLI